MKRKYVYGLLALPILALFIYFLTLPSATRAMFISEFRYPTAVLFGAKTEPSEGLQGPRFERSDENGPQSGAVVIRKLMPIAMHPPNSSGCAPIKHKHNKIETSKANK